MSKLRAELEKLIEEVKSDRDLTEQIRGYRVQRREYERAVGTAPNRPAGVIAPVRREHRV